MRQQQHPEHGGTSGAVVETDQDIVCAMMLTAAAAVSNGTEEGPHGLHSAESASGSKTHRKSGLSSSGVSILSIVYSCIGKFCVI